jgi:methyltransferase (TIGR00027 family)
MEEGKPSRTAILVAAYRGRYTEADPPICNDPWAKSLAGEEGDALMETWDAIQPPVGLWVAVRTAFIDDCLLRRIAPSGPCRQVVILGAGLDTRAARLLRDGVRTFEVDHPMTQRVKRERVARLKGYPADKATYVSCDFATEDFLDRLVASGFDPDVPAYFVWEGVTLYLTEEVVRATLSRIASTHPQSTVIFDHIGKKLVDRQISHAMDVGTVQGVAELGEPFRWGTNHVLPLLYEVGFRRVRITSFDEACLNLTGTYDRERRFRFQTLAEASRAP